MSDFATAIITGGVVGVVFTGLFSLIQMFVNRRWQKQDKKDEKHEELKSAIEELKGEFSGIKDALETHIDEADRRDAVLCRSRILRFADELINEPEKKHTLGHFQQMLGDCTDYVAYCESHPGFKNQIAEQSINIINEVYNRLCMEHKFA